MSDSRVLIGRPAIEPAAPRAFEKLQLDAGRRLTAGRGRARSIARRAIAAD